MSLLRKSDVTMIKKLLKSYFLELEDEKKIQTSFRVVSDRMTPQGMRFNFLFSPGIDNYGLEESAAEADEEYLYHTFNFDNFAKAFEGTRYQLVDLDAHIDYGVEIPDADDVRYGGVRSIDLWKGSFVVDNVYGRECTTGDLTDFDLSYTHPSGKSFLPEVETYIQRRMNPRRNNPSKSKSILGALILGGIIGHSMKKK